MSSGAPSPAASAGGGLGSPPPVATSSPPVSSSSNNGSTPGASSAPPVSQPSASPPPAAAIPPVSPPPAASSPPPTSSPPPASSPPPTSAPPPSSSNSTQTPRVSPAPVSSPPPAQSPPPSPVVTSPPPPPLSAPVNRSPPPAATPPGSSTSSPPPVASPPPASSIIPPTPPTKPSPKGSPPSPEAPAPTAIVRSPPPPGKLTPGSPSSAPPTQTSTGNTSNVTPPLKSPPPASSSTPLGGSGSPSSASDGSGGSGGLSGVAIGGIAVGGLIVLALIGLLIWCTKKRRRRDGYSGDHFGQPPAGGFPAKSERVYASNSPGSDQYLRKTSSPSTQGYGYENSHRGRHGSSGEVASGVPEHPTPNPGLGNSKSWFTYEELGVATDGFSAQNLIGEGGFGCVYKGYLPDGQVVAVKQLKVGSGQGEREFQAEVEIISRVHHRHLVSLVGYCIAESQRLLVYDYVPNGNLEQHLHGRGRPVMNWVTRQKIAVGAARGLAYLHEDCHPRIIHRDIKSSNILLDDKFEAQVSDFGLAKLASDTSTHVTTRVMGTFGYMAPEYASSGKLTERSDVFSFGVVLLELVAGRKPVDTSQPLGDESLVEWARPLLTCALEEGNFEGLVDPKLENNFDGSEMLRMVEAAAACVRHSAHRRPRMGQVVRVLEHGSAISDLNNGVKPGQSTLYNSAQYSADIRRFRRMAFGSQEYGSDYSGFTSEYEFNPSVSSSEFHNSKERKVEPMKYGKNELETQSASGGEYPSSGESETRAINRSYLHRDETSDKSSGEVPSTFRDEPLTGR